MLINSTIKFHAIVNNIKYSKYHLHS